MSMIPFFLALLLVLALTVGAMHWPIVRNLAVRPSRDSRGSFKRVTNSNIGDAGGRTAAARDSAGGNPGKRDAFSDFFNFGLDRGAGRRQLIAS